MPPPVEGTGENTPFFIAAESMAFFAKNEFL